MNTKNFLFLPLLFFVGCGDINLTNNGNIEGEAKIEAETTIVVPETATAATTTTTTCLEGNCSVPDVPEPIETVLEELGLPVPTPCPAEQPAEPTPAPTVSPTPTPVLTPEPTATPAPTPEPTPVDVPAEFSDPTFCVNRVENERFVYCQEQTDWETVSANVPSGYALPIIASNFNDVDVVHSPDDAEIRALIHPSGEQRVWALQDCNQLVGSEKNNCINKTNNFRSIWTYNTSTDKGAGFLPQNSSQSWSLAEIAVGVRYDGCSMGAEFLGEDCYREKWEALAHPLYKKVP